MLQKKHGYPRASATPGISGPFRNTVAYAFTGTFPTIAPVCIHGYEACHISVVASQTAATHRHLIESLVNDNCRSIDPVSHTSSAKDFVQNQEIALRDNPGLRHLRAIPSYPKRLFQSRARNRYDARVDRSRIGIISRFWAVEESSTDLAVGAAQAALEQAGLTAADIDVIIVATSTPDFTMPSTACLVQGRLGAELRWHSTLLTLGRVMSSLSTRPHATCAAATSRTRS